MSKDVLSDMQPGCPHILEVLYAFPHADAPMLEKLMHEHFAAYRVHGEWFELPQDIPTTLALLSYVYRHVAAKNPQPAFDPTTRNALNTRIMESLKEHHTLSVASLAEKLGVPRNGLRVNLHRLYTAGFIGKTSLGIYHTLDTSIYNANTD